MSFDSRDNDAATVHKLRVPGIDPLDGGYRNLLAVDTKSLDSEAELKRFFGAKVVRPPRCNRLTVRFPIVLTETHR